MSAPAKFSVMAIGMVAGYLIFSRIRNKRAISDEKVLIVGASSGVGLEIAREYAQQRGKDVSLHLVARKPLNNVCQDLQSSGIKSVTSTQADVTKPAEVYKLAQELKQAWPQIDTVIICAGALTVQPILCLTGQAESGSPTSVADELPSADKLQRLSQLAQESYSANVLPSLILCTALLPALLRSPAPRVTVLSSVAAEIPAPTRTLYAANKAALSIALRSLRIELENLVLKEQSGKFWRKSVGVTIVHPASIDTGLRSAALDADAGLSGSKERKAMQPGQVARSVIEAIQYEEDEVWLPKSYWWISKLGMVLLPNRVKEGAKKKYGFA